MPDYLVEAYAPRPGVDLSALEARARVAAEEMRGEGIDVRYLRSIFVPEDEICFHLFQAPSADAVGEASGARSLRTSGSSRRHGPTSREEE